MSRTIAIGPVSRIEGHARITIRLDAGGRVEHARLHVGEFRGFEAFCAGRPFWEMPVITARICGICPVSHALTAALAGEAIMGIQAPPTARLLRETLSLAQLLLSHALSFFHLSAPDIVLGLDADPAERNIVGLARRHPDLIRDGIRLRRIAQEFVNRIGGGQLHPEHVVAGGMRQPLSETDRDTLAAQAPEIRDLVAAAVACWEEHGTRFLAEMGEWPEKDVPCLGLVTASGSLGYTSGRLRFGDRSGQPLQEVAGDAYRQTIGEDIRDDSYLKPTRYLPATGGEAATDPWYRVGPLARLHTAPFCDAPLAEQARQRFLGSPLAGSSLGSHAARLIEMQYAAERLARLLDDPQILGSHTLEQGAVRETCGVGVTEAPRGTLIHDYRVDRHGLLTGVNLIVATGHNSRAMDDTITAIARCHITGDTLTEGLLNRVEHGIRLYDPCLSCATHTHGRLGMVVELRDRTGRLLDHRYI